MATTTGVLTGTPNSQDQGALWQQLMASGGVPGALPPTPLTQSPPGVPGTPGTVNGDPMDQNILKLLNKYWPNRQGRSQLEMLAMGGAQNTPLRQAAGVPNLMDRGMPPFTPGNVASGVAPVGLPPPPAAGGAAPGATPGAANAAASTVDPREAAGRSLMNWINSENQRMNMHQPVQTDWTLFSPRETQYDLALDQARLAGF